MSRRKMTRRSPGIPLVLACLLGFSAAASGQSPRQTSADAYTRYELQAPETRTFRIVYDVTAASPGARLYFNPIRKGSEPTVHAVIDLSTGKPLRWQLVPGSRAEADGLTGADTEMQYLRIELASPVPALTTGASSVSPVAGEARLRIDKSYEDPASYRHEGDRLVFERSLGVRRNAVVLPAGYELLAANYPVQVALEVDGRLRLSFMNRGFAAVPLRVEARRLPERSGTVPANAGGGSLAPSPPVEARRPSGARIDFSFDERAFQDREIVYYLRQPETHSFRLYHDYTETREGMDRYLNVVRSGSKASNPEAWNVDTGERLKVETLRGKSITERGLDLGGAPVEADTEVVVIWFEAVKPGASTRLRIEETYTDATRYGLDGDELLWDRSFGRPRNEVVLPEGWSLTESAEPAVIDQLDDGRTRLSFTNDRPNQLEVFLRARRR